MGFLNPAIFISFIPILILLFVILPQQKRNKKKAFLKKIYKKRGIKMNNETINKYLGKECAINTLDQYVEGKLVSLVGKWLEIEVESKKEKSIELVNVQFIEKISIKGR